MGQSKQYSCTQQTRDLPFIPQSSLAFFAQDPWQINVYSSTFIYSNVSLNEKLILKKNYLVIYIKPNDENLPEYQK